MEPAQGLGLSDTPNELELIELAAHAHRAVSLTLFSELHAFANHLNLDWRQVQIGICKSLIIAGMGQPPVPALDGRPGYGGPHLVNSMERLRSSMTQAGFHSSLVQYVPEANLRYRQVDETQ